MVADGAGSAKYSDVGAKLAVNTVLETITEKDISDVTELFRTESSVSEPENKATSIKKTSNSLDKLDQKNSATVTIAKSPEEKARKLFSNIVYKIIKAFEEQATKIVTLLKI